MISIRRLAATLQAVALLALVAPSGLAQTPPPTDRVLGMRVEGLELSAKDKDDLFHVVQAKLRLYPTIDLLKPPEVELTDEMFELECFEIDVECLTRLGRKYGASKVFYAEVNMVDAGFQLRVSVVDAEAGVAMREEMGVAAARADLAGALEREVEAVFGAPPPPKPVKGRLVVEAAIAGAQIFIDGAYVGTGKIDLEQKPGTYSVRVAKEGHEESIFQLTVEAGKAVSRTVRLEPLPEAPPPTTLPPTTPDPGEEAAPVYQEWWFWTALVGGAAVVAAAIAVPVALGSDSGPTPTGSMVISVDHKQAWRDSAIVRGGAGAR